MSDHVVPVLQTAGLTKVFKDFWRRNRVEAVKDLNLVVRPGEVFGLLGPNGSGKSTTIKMILGLLYPTRGRISVFGKPPTDVGIKARIGFLPEESYLYEFLDARETLDYYGRLFRQTAGVRRERIERLLEMVGLTHESQRRIGEYSKGMARRIGLAQALINDPDFLILDEPTSGMDPIGTRQIKNLVRELANKGKTILLSSHLLADVEDVCDRVCILYGGQEHAAGDVKSLLSQANQTQITTERLSPETIDRLKELLGRLENKRVLDVSSPLERLESYFIRIVESAQAANVGTSGARVGGALPGFFSDSAPAPTNVIDGLIEAAEETPGEYAELPGPAMDPVPADEFKTEEVVGDLLEGGRRSSAGVGDRPSETAAPAPAAGQPPGTAPAFNRELIEGLIKPRRGEQAGE